MAVLGNLHVILFCQITVFGRVSLGASGVAVSVEDEAKCNGGIDSWRIQTTHTINSACECD